MFYRRSLIVPHLQNLGYNRSTDGEEEELRVGIIPNSNTIIAKKITNNGDIVTWQLSTVPHCCGSLFFSNLRKYATANETGVAKKVTMDVVSLAKELGYSQITCIIPDCAAYKSATIAFQKAGWKYLRGSRVKNKRSDNILKTYYINVWEYNK